MNKQVFLELVDSLAFPKEEYYILGSGSLLLHGLRSVANDLDICVSEELFEQLKSKIDLNSKNECGFYRLNSVVEVVVNKKEDFLCDYCNGYPVEKLENILEFKKQRNKEKDLKDIEAIENYLMNNQKKL